MAARRTAIFVGGTVLAMAGALVLFSALMRPSAGDLRVMIVLLATTTAVSLVVGYGAYLSGWFTRLPHLSWALLAGWILAAALTYLNVYATARLMFLNAHDLLLAGVLLIFAGGIGLSFGYLVSSAVTDNLVRLERAAHRVAAGDLTVSVPVRGRDEVAGLARAFNTMTARLEEADRRQRELEALRRDLITWVGHDLRTPLASVRVIVEALADGVVDDPDTVRRYLRTAQKDVASLSALIEDLFVLTQLDAGGLQLDRRPNSLADLISDTIESFSPRAERQGVRLWGEAAPDVDPVPFDAQHIGRVLANLVENALRHTPEGGEVRVTAWSGRDGAEVEVSDTGAGIDPEDLPRVFERFYRGERSRNRETGGAGLGLAIVQSIVGAHGGRVGVESRSGQGTRFLFTLPRQVDGLAGRPV